MTAEILIMNKEAIAIAADSASTISPQKIFKANKIFTLSKKAPIGIMFYEHPFFMGIPWETLTKLYQNEQDDLKFATLEEYTNNFFRYVINKDEKFLEEIQQNDFKEFLNSDGSLIFEGLKKRIIKRCEERIEKMGAISLSGIEKISNQIISNGHIGLKRLKYPLNFTNQDTIDIIEKYDSLINECIEEVFEKIPLSHSLPLLKEIISDSYLKWYVKENNLSGVIIFGFGDSELFPSYKEFRVYGFINGLFRYEVKDAANIALNKKAVIAPFAQRDVVDSFIRGILPNFEEKIDTMFFDAFDLFSEEYIEKNKLKGKEKSEFHHNCEDIAGELISYFEHRRYLIKQEYVNSLLNVVEHLSNSELAEMAEFLINMISFRRRMTMSPETVSGPIDVAVITKGDGFVWIKRKHYFSLDLNPDFHLKKLVGHYNYSRTHAMENKQ
jgi:hypothetical protein